MGRLIDSLFGLRREERTLALLMAGYHVLLLVSLYLLKPVRDSLFLANRGPEELPFVFLLTTAAVLPVAILHTRAGEDWALGPLIDGASVLLVVSVLGLRVLLSVGGEWVTYLLYAWVSVYGLVVTSQFWLMANALFTASQSKRVFPLLSAGAIVGAIVGGELTGLLVDEVGVASQSLLWGGAGVLLAATALGRGIRAYYRRWEGAASAASPDGEVAAGLGAAAIIRDSRHIQLIVAVLGLMVVVTTLVDYQFKTVAARAYPTAEGLTTFLGHFYGRVSIVALLVQLVLAPWLMRTVGIGGALSILPGMLAVGAVGMIVVPGLVAGVFMRGSGQSLKHSVDKTGRELLFVPVPLEKKKRVKVFVDLFVDQGAEGLGGLLLLALVYGLGASVPVLSGVTLALIAVWGGLAYRARQTYVDQFRRRLRDRRATPEQPPEPDASADVDALLDSLCSHAEREALRALERLADGTMPVPVEAVVCLLDHPSAAVRERALRVLRVREVPDQGEAAAEALRDPDPDVQLAAARYLYCQLTDNHFERIRQGLQHDDPQIQAATVGVIAEEGGREEYELVSEALLRRLVAVDGRHGAETRTQVARILGVLDRPFRTDLLRRLLDDEDPGVVRAALRAAGRSGDRAFVVPLIRRLADDRVRAEAQQALAEMGPSILGTLYDHLVDPDCALEARRALPPVLAAHPRPFAATLLLRSLSRVPVPVRHAAVRALGTLQREGDVAVDPDAVEAALERELEHVVALGQIRRWARRNGDALPPERLDAVREEALERLFRLLGLRYDHRDIYDAYLGVTSDDPSLRDSAIEFVDNLVDYDIRRRLLPLLDDPDGEQAVRVGRSAFDLHLQTRDAVRGYLREAADPRLRALADGSEVSASARPDAPRPVSPTSASE